eukprot:gene14779-16314_t
MLGVSKWTISRRVKQYDLESLQGFSDISDEDLDPLVEELLKRQGRTMGQVFIVSYLKSKGLLVQRRRVRDCLLRVDPDNRILHWGVVISRRVMNFALEEYLKMFNGHKIRTARHVTPNQLWTNGMLDTNNPLGTDKLHEDPEDLEHFAEDAPGPTPFDNSRNSRNSRDVIVEPSLYIFKGPKQ